jgi:hypothetical protein
VIGTPGSKDRTPETEPAPTAGGLGAGAGAVAPAGGAPEKVVCKDYAYRYNIKTAGRTQYFLVDTISWKILEPTRRERSRTGAHGRDVYCLPESAWEGVLVVKLERSNSGKLSYNVITYSEKVMKYAVDLEMFLARGKDFDHMVAIIVKYVEIERLLNVWR